ncbi:MAG: cupin domain-containing protein [Gammaproteobacteria bacterium]
MDALSDVLRAVRLSGAVYFDIRAAEPWVAETPAGPYGSSRRCSRAPNISSRIT